MAQYSVKRGKQNTGESNDSVLVKGYFQLESEGQNITERMSYVTTNV